MTKPEYTAMFYQCSNIFLRLQAVGRYVKVQDLIKICIYFNFPRTVEMAGEAVRPPRQDNAICLQP